MRRDDTKIRAAAKRLIRAGVPLDLPVASGSPPVIVRAIADYDVCEVFEMNPVDAAVIANVKLMFMKTAFVEEVSLELPWDGEVDDWLEPTRNQKNGNPDYGFSPGQRYPATMVLNGCLSGRIKAGTVLQGLLLGISHMPIPQSLKSDDIVLASLKITCAPGIIVPRSLQMRVGRKVSRVRPLAVPSYGESLLGGKDAASGEGAPVERSGRHRP